MRIRDDVGLRCLFDLQEKIIRFCARSVPRHTEWFIWSRSNPQRSEKHCLLSELQEQCELRDWRHAFYISLCLLEEPEHRSQEDESGQKPGSIYVSFICMFDCCPHIY